jgi:hypothetical protein
MGAGVVGHPIVKDDQNRSNLGMKCPFIYEIRRYQTGEKESSLRRLGASIRQRS